MWIQHPFGMREGLKSCFAVKWTHGGHVQHMPMVYFLALVLAVVPLISLHFILHCFYDPHTRSIKIWLALSLGTMTVNC